MKKGPDTLYSFRDMDNFKIRMSWQSDWNLICVHMMEGSLYPHLCLVLRLNGNVSTRYELFNLFYLSPVTGTWYYKLVLPTQTVNPKRRELDPYHFLSRFNNVRSASKYDPITIDFRRNWFIFWYSCHIYGSSIYVYI